MQGSRNYELDSSQGTDGLRSFLRGVAERDTSILEMASEHAAELPSPGLIWWRAQILRKQEEKRRIERPMMIMRMLAAMVCAVVFLVATASTWQQGQSLPILMMVVAIAVSLVSAAVLLWSPAKE